jgi:hypothetical protein
MTDPTPPIFDADQSIRGLLYEYSMVVETALVMTTQGFDNPAIDYALLESFLVHARNLHEFLRPHKEDDRRPGDYWSSDFVNEFGVTIFDATSVQKTNRWLQHLTTWRYDDDEHPAWPVNEMLREIVQGMDAFLREIDPQLASPLTETHRSARTLIDTF